MSGKIKDMWILVKYEIIVNYRENYSGEIIKTYTVKITLQ